MAIGNSEGMASNKPQTDSQNMALNMTATEAKPRNVVCLES